MKMRTPAALAAAVALLVTSCGSSDPAADSRRLQVVVGFYPLGYLAQRIGGDLVQTTSLAQPGAEPHDLELRPQQIQQIAEADLVLRLAGLQPAVDDAAAENAGDRSLDLLTATDVVAGYAELDHAADGDEQEESGIDPHVWLDPTRYSALAGAVADRLSTDDPDHAADYAANRAALDADLTAVDQEYRTGLADCERHEIVTTHNAFGYLAARYGLEQVGISGLSPEDEPSPQDLDEVQRYAEEHGVTTIFYEDAVTPEYAETVAREVGATTAVLSPLEVVDDGEDYLSVMRANLDTLTDALGCR